MRFMKDRKKNKAHIKNREMKMERQARGPPGKNDERDIKTTRGQYERKVDRYTENHYIGM
jgi:hypothetical protein